VTPLKKPDPSSSRSGEGTGHLFQGLYCMTQPVNLSLLLGKKKEAYGFSCVRRERKWQPALLLSGGHQGLHYLFRPAQKVPTITFCDEGRSYRWPREGRTRCLFPRQGKEGFSSRTRRKREKTCAPAMKNGCGAFNITCPDGRTITARPFSSSLREKKKGKDKQGGCYEQEKKKYPEALHPDYRKGEE